MLYQQLRERWIPDKEQGYDWRIIGGSNTYSLVFTSLYRSNQCIPFIPFSRRTFFPPFLSLLLRGNGEGGAEQSEGMIPSMSTCFTMAMNCDLHHRVVIDPPSCRIHDECNTLRACVLVYLQGNILERPCLARAHSSNHPYAYCH